MATSDTERSSIFLERFLGDPKNDQAYGKFARKYGPRIKERCQSRLRLQDADADDLTAEILLRFFEGDRLEAFVFSTRTKFEAWLHRVVERACFDFIRHRQRHILATWSPDGKRILTAGKRRGSPGGTSGATVWNLDNGRKVVFLLERSCWPPG